MTPSPSPLTAALANAESFALIARDGVTVELLTGDILDVARLADIPLSGADAAPREVLALVPFRQVVERGFQCHDDLAPLRCLIVQGHQSFPRTDALTELPSAPIALQDAGFDI